MKPRRTRRVRCSAWLGDSSIGKSGDDPWRGSVTFREIDNTRSELGKVDDYPGAMAVLVDALKAKGVRPEEIRFEDADVVRNEHYIVVLRGDACKLLDRLNESQPSPLARKKTGLQLLADTLGRLGRAVVCNGIAAVQVHARAPRFVQIVLGCRPVAAILNRAYRVFVSHACVKSPNDPSSATRRQGGAK